MKLVGSHGEKFELRILGYEFPEIEDDEPDSNWLVIEVEVTHRDGHWVARDPSLLTYEIKGLARWLTKIAHGEETTLERDFVEPNLTFRIVELTPTSKALRIYFELESRPGWRPTDGSLMEDLWVEFLLDELDLEMAAESLRKQLSKYPQRAVD